MSRLGRLIQFRYYSPFSGPCMTLVVSKGDTGEGVVEGLREFLGPPDVEQAKESAPER